MKDMHNAANSQPLLLDKMLNWIKYKIKQNNIEHIEL